MIQPVFVLAAETVLIDRATNTMSIINVFEELTPSGYPLLLPRFTVLALSTREPDDPAVTQAQVLITIDNDETVFDGQTDVDFGVTALLHRSLLQFQGLVVSQPGTLRITFAIEDAQVESYPMRALPAAPPPPAQLS
jgi:hypothetical protein